MSHEHKLLEAALRMALKDPQSVGQRGLSIVLGAGQHPPALIVGKAGCK